MTPLEKINGFLSSINLEHYRQKYSHIKLVELDLPRDIQAIHCLYEEYWEKRDGFSGFENFFQTYAGGNREILLENFRREAMFSRETFYRGLPARIYRTWAALLTQIQGGYAAEELYGKGNVSMSAELDYKGIDIQITTTESTYNIQIKKETLSREVRVPWQRMKNGVPIVTIHYEVPGCDPKTSTGKNSVPFQRWMEKWKGRLDRLDNGFIIFRPQMFSPRHITVP